MLYPGRFAVYQKASIALKLKDLKNLRIENARLQKASTRISLGEGPWENS